MPDAGPRVALLVAAAVVIDVVWICGMRLGDLQFVACAALLCGCLWLETRGDPSSDLSGILSSSDLALWWTRARERLACALDAWEPWALERLANAREGLANAREGLANAREGLANAREGLANAREGLANAREGLANAREGALALWAREGLANARERLREAFRLHDGKKMLALVA